MTIVLALVAAAPASAQVPPADRAFDAQVQSVALSASPPTLAFGGRDVDDGPSFSEESKVTNTGTESVTITGVVFSGTHAADFSRFSGLAIDCEAGKVLTAGEYCLVRVRFDPSTTGGRSATVSVTSNAPTVDVPLTGTGKQGTLAASPPSLAFGARDVDDGPSFAEESTVTNTGAETVTISGVVISGGLASDFERFSGLEADCEAGKVLTAGQTCTLRVRFDPSGTDVRSSTITVTSSALDLSVDLTGTGTQTALSANPPGLVFDARDVDDEFSSAKESTIMNAGSETVTITGVAITGAHPSDFDRLTGLETDCEAGMVLAEGENCVLRVRFNPTTTGAREALASVTSNAPDVSAAVFGTGTQTALSASPPSIAFGARDIDDGFSAHQESTVTNTGTESVTISGVVFGGAHASEFGRFSGLEDDCEAGKVLAAGGTCLLRIRFDPAATGGRAATVSVTSNAPDVNVGLTGTGTQTALSASPPSIAFGARDIDDGFSAHQESTVTNTGTEAVTIAGVVFSGAHASEFDRFAGLEVDCEAGEVLTAGQSCKLRVRFDPAATGERLGTVSVTANAPSVNVALTGTGTQTTPDTFITSGPTGNTDNTSAAFEFTASEPGLSFVCVLDGTEAACSSPANYTGLQTGEHTLAVRACHANGLCDPSPATRTWTVVPPPPAEQPPPPETTAGTVPSSGGTVSDDPLDQGPTSSEPVTTAVTAPSGGEITITEVSPSGAPSGFSFLGQQVNITSTVASDANSPLRIVFTVDAAVVGDTPLADISVFRDNEKAGECPGSTVANPDPCVANRELVSGDARLTVLTAHASQWNVARSVTPAPTATPTPAAPAPTPAAVPSASILTRRTTVKRRKLAIRVACSGAPCRGTLVLRTTVKQKGKTRTVRLGSKGFTLARGANATITITLSKKNLALLRRIRAPRAEVTVQLAGIAKPVRSTLRITVPKG